jgi:hypothetical protein
MNRSPGGYFKPLLDPGGGFTFETTVRFLKRPARNRYGSDVTSEAVKNL